MGVFGFPSTWQTNCYLPSTCWARKHRIWERGERYNRRLSDRNHHPRLRHLLPVPPPLPPHHHPHHLCSIQGPQREPFKLCQPSTKGLQATTSGAPVKCSPSI